MWHIQQMGEMGGHRRVDVGHDKKVQRGNVVHQHLHEVLRTGGSPAELGQRGEEQALFLGSTR